MKKTLITKEETDLLENFNIVIDNENDFFATKIEGSNIYILSLKGSNNKKFYILDINNISSFKFQDDTTNFEISLNNNSSVTFNHSSNVRNIIFLSLSNTLSNFKNKKKNIQSL